jgi:hypothetical protein
MFATKNAEIPSKSKLYVLDEYKTVILDNFHRSEKAMKHFGRNCL